MATSPPSYFRAQEEVWVDPHCFHLYFSVSEKALALLTFFTTFKMFFKPISAISFQLSMKTLCHFPLCSTQSQGNVT